MLKTLKFQKNYNNKLNCDVFTTLRKKGCGIHRGNKVAIVLNDKVYKWVEIIDVVEINYQDIPPILLAIDTGITDSSVHALFERFGVIDHSRDTEVAIITCLSIPRPHEYSNPETAIQLSLYQERQ